jgi:hypothetical protein
MMIRKLVFGSAMALLTCAMAWGQAKPTYDDALAAVTDGGCERSETERYVRFHCQEGEALWYFTHEGRPEHAAYFVAPAYPLFFDRFTVVPSDPRRSPDDAPIVSSFSRGQPSGANSRE